MRVSPLFHRLGFAFPCLSPQKIAQENTDQLLTGVGWIVQDKRSALPPSGKKILSSREGNWTGFPPYLSRG
jgi:hypothetical protein